MKTPRGSVKKRGTRWLARLTWSDPRDRSRRFTRKKYVGSRNAGLDALTAWRDELAATGTIRPASSREDGPARRTFADLADFYEQAYAIPPVYRDEKKIAGQRSWKTTRGHVAHLRAHIGETYLDALDWNELDEARRDLLGGMTWKGDARSVSYTNRVLSTCRRMLRVARQKKWMKHNPFEEGDPLIQRAHEVERQRILTTKEEAALLAACTEEKRREHLRAIIITAVETGMRMGEMLKMEKEQIDWKAGVIRVKAFHTKTMEERIVPLTARLKKELRAWIAKTPPRRRLVFGVLGNVDTAFRGAKSDAGIEGLRFHDLRHTAASRMISAGIPEAQVGRILGHKIAQTTRRYVNVDVSVANEASRKMNKRRVTLKKRR